MYFLFLIYVLVALTQLNCMKIKDLVSNSWWATKLIMWRFIDQGMQLVCDYFHHTLLHHMHFSPRKVVWAMNMCTNFAKTTCDYSRFASPFETGTIRAGTNPNLTRGSTRPPITVRGLYVTYIPTHACRGDHIPMYVGIWSLLVVRCD